MRRLRARLTEQAGIALPVALTALSLLLALVAVTATQASQVGTSSNEDRNSKRALAAAEAGLQVAAYRVQKVSGLDDGECLTDLPVLSGATGECPSLEESLGNGASFSYVVTPKLDPGVSCAGESVPPPAGAKERCITSTGQVAGFSRRVQTRVRALPGGGYLGLMGLTKVRIDNSGTLNQDNCPGGATGCPPLIGANGDVELRNSVDIRGALAYPSGATVCGAEPPTNPCNPPSSSVHIEGRETGGGDQVLSTPFEIPPIDFAPSLLSNDNGRILTFSRSNVTYDATTRELTIGNSGYLELREGVYNFCRLAVPNSGEIRIPLGEKVKIYIDSPANPTSGCNTGSGELLDERGETALNNSVRFNSPSGASDAELGERAANLQLYVFGNPPSDCSDPDVDLNNSVSFAGTIEAPNSCVRLRNSVNMVGAVASDRLQLDNSITFRKPSTLADYGGVNSYRRKAWTECRPAPTATLDPESGCE